MVKWLYFKNRKIYLSLLLTGMIICFGAGSAKAVPVIDFADNNSGGNIGIKKSVVLKGNGFEDGVTVKLTKDGQQDLTANNVTVVMSKEIYCDFNLTGASTGSWNIVVNNPDGPSTTFANGFTVETLPSIINTIAPSSAKNIYQVQSFTIFGSNFTEDTAVKITKDGQSDIMAIDLEVIDSSSIKFNLNLKGVATGIWTVAVIYPDQQTASLTDSLLITEK